MSLISFIIPHFNSFEFIQETISSIESQSYTNYEIIVIDDTSEEQVFSRLKEFLHQREKVKLVRLPKKMVKGANSCRNFGLEISRGDYINFVDSDDLLLPTKIAKQLEVFEGNPDLGMVVCKTQYFEGTVSNRKEVLQKDDFFVEDDFLENFLSRKANWCTNSALIKREKLNKVQFRPGFLDAHEWLLYVELMIGGISIGFVNEILVLKRKHANSIGNMNLSKKLPSLIESRLLVYELLKTSGLCKPQYVLYLNNDLNSYLKSSAKRGLFKLYVSTLSKFNLPLTTQLKSLSLFLIYSVTKRGDSFKFLNYIR